jgi:predicted MPP superfamily phosphohydrolase
MTIAKDTATFAPSPRPAPLTRRTVLRSGLGLIGAAGLLGGASGGYALAEAAFELKVTPYALRPQNWPTGRRLSIAVIADLHAGGPNMGTSRVDQVVDTCNGLNCDLIVLLGDFFANHHFVTEHLSTAKLGDRLGRLRAPLGVWSILGNHDWWHDIEGVRSLLARAKIPVMENRAVLLGAGAQRFWLAGLGDQIAYQLGYNRYRGVDDLPGTLAQVNTDDPVILLAHEPDIFTRVPSRVALTLAGHTHGGQIRIPFLWEKFVPSAYGARFAYGHVVEGERHLVVSGGLGTSLIPLRLGVPPEIVRIDLGA